MTETAVQQKYTRIIELLLEKVGDPLEKCDEVIERICALMEIAPPPASSVSANEKTEAIMSTLSQADRIAKGIALIEQAMDGYLNRDQLKLKNELEDLTSFTASILPPAASSPAPKNLGNLLDQITGLEEGYTVRPHGNNGPPPNYMQGHRNFFFEDKVYVAPSGEKRVLRTQAVHDFVPTVNPDDLMGPRKPGSKISYDDYTIEDPRRKMAAPTGFSFGVAVEEKPSPVATASPVRPIGVAPIGGGVKPSPVVVGPSSPAKPSPAPAAQPASPPAAAPAGETDIDKLTKAIPKWTKGPPSTNEEIDEYKKFMKDKYEAEARLNAEILRQKKLKEGK